MLGQKECGGLIYYCEVRWLSKEKMLKRFYDLRDEIATFMDMKGKIIPELIDDNWVRDLVFLVDLTMHFNDLNTKLQGQFVHHLYSHVKTFQSKLNSFDNTFHFPTLAGCGKSKCAPYADELISMNEEFDHRSQDFRSQESSLHMFSSPFDVNVEQAPEEFQWD